MLRAAPLAVGGLLRERLFGRSTVVLTSATLTLGGTFDALARQWGLPPERRRGRAATAPDDAGHGRQDPDAPRWSGLDVGSPFEHAKSGILYVAKRLPPPGRDGLPPAYLDEIAGLVEAAGGRTLGLFSSMRAAKQATEALRDRLDTPLLCQGDDSTMLLVKRFAEDEATSLFGTLSLWQGVDVPGPSLSCVIIDRIPFPRPDDPLVAARQRAADSRGGNGFLTVVGDARRAAARAGRGPAAARHGRPRRRRDPRPAPGDRPLRRLPARLAAAVLADRRPGEGPRRPAPPPRRLTHGRASGSRCPPAARRSAGVRPAAVARR